MPHLQLVPSQIMHGLQTLELPACGYNQNGNDGKDSKVKASLVSFPTGCMRHHVERNESTMHLTMVKRVLTFIKGVENLG